MEQSNPFLKDLEEAQLERALPVTQPGVVEQSSGFIDTVIDVGKGVLSGPLKEVENLVQSGHDIANFVDEKFLGDKFINNDKDYDFVPDAIKPKGGAGKTAQAISAFAAGWFSFGTKIKAATKGMKVFQAMPPVGAAIGTAVGGGAVDFVTGDGTDERLADALLDNDIVGGAVVEFLASDPTDTAAEGRMKNVLEGFIIGAALDGAMTLFKGIRNSFKAGSSEGISGTLKARRAASQEHFKEVAKGGKSKLVDEKTLTMLPEAKKQAARKKILESALKTDGEAMFNYNKFSDPVRDEFYKLNKPIYEAVRHDTMSMRELAGDAVEEVSRMTGDVFGNIDMLRQGTASFKEGAGIVARATLELEQRVMPELIMASKAVTDGAPGSPENLKAVTTRVIEWAIELKKLYRSAGQAVKAADVLSFIAREDGDTAVKSMLDNALDAAKQTANMLSPEQIRELSTRIIEAHEMGGNILVPILNALPETHGLVKSVVRDSKGWKALEHYRYSAMLSSLRGRVRDAISMTTKSVIMPFEKSVSGMVEGFMAEGLGGAAQGAKRGKYYVQGMYQAMDHAWKMSKVAFNNGTSVLRGGNLGRIDADVLKEFTGLNALSNNSVMGKTISAPVRLMAAMDEFFGQTHYYAETFERLMRGLNESKIAAAIVDPKEYKEFVDAYIRENMDGAFREVVLAGGTRHKGGAVFKEGLKAANDATYQTPLTDVGRKFHTAIQSNKATRFLFPFFKTPVNLLMDAFWIRSPIGAGYDLAQAIKTQNPEALTEAAGHLATGLTLWGSVWGLVASGRITGAGPSNKAAKNALMENGWQPYSLKVGDGYVSLSAFDPFSSALMVLADGVEIAQQMNGEPVEDVSQALLNSVMTFAKNRTYFQGVANIIDSMDREAGRGRFLVNQISSFIPAAFRDAAQAVDPTIYEARTMIDAFKARTMPALMGAIPQYNWLTGDPQVYSHGGGLGAFSPIVKTDGAMDIVFGELGKARNISTPTRKVGDAELSSDEYAEYCRLHGKVKIGGKTMYEALRTVVMSNQYDAARLRSNDPNSFELDERRAEALRKIVMSYRKEARAELLRKYPHLREQADTSSSNSKNVFRASNNPFGSITSF